MSRFQIIDEKADLFSHARNMCVLLAANKFVDPPLQQLKILLEIMIKSTEKESRTELIAIKRTLKTQYGEETSLKILTSLALDNNELQILLQTVGNSEPNEVN